VLAVKVTAPVLVPEAGETASHAALSLALQLRVPPPVLLMFRVCAAGLLPPAVALNEKLVGLAPIAGGAGAGGGDEVVDEGAGFMSCVSPGISAARRDMDRPVGALLPPFVVAPAALVAPANAAPPVTELRGAIEFGVAVVIVVLAAVLFSVDEVVAMGAAVLALLVSLDRFVMDEMSVLADAGLRALTVAGGGFCDFLISR
jgi:hypothetical protein